MAYQKKSESINFQDLPFLVDELVRGVTDLIDAETGGDYNVIEFVDNEVNLGIQLSLQQRLVLKCYYGLPLTEEELSILEYWRLMNRSSWEPNQEYQRLVLAAGRRSFKTGLSAIIASYEFYRLCKMASPQAHYGIASSSPIDILVLATTADQAKRFTFKNIVGIVTNSPFFKSLAARGQLSIGKEEISYPEKLLSIYSGNSQSGAQVGGTLKCLVMDEVARFKDVDGASNALELWSNLGNSTVTFGKEARLVAISSAWYEGDAIQTLFERSFKSPGMLGFELCSWDLNPVHAARDNPVIIAAYEEEPFKAALEFENIRPAAVDAFFNTEEVKAAFIGNSAVDATVIDIPNGEQLLRGIELNQLKPVAANAVAVHLDPALTRDAYGLAFGHSEFDEQGRQLVVIDGLLAWEPTYNRQVSITNVQDAILRLHAEYNVIKLTADHHNSAETLQRLRQEGILCESEFFSNRLQLSMYDITRQLMHEGRLVLPKDSRWTPLLLRELTQVQLIRNQKIDHPKTAGASKDLADCVAGVCWSLAKRLPFDSTKGSRAPRLINNRPLTTATTPEAPTLFKGSAREQVLAGQARNRWLNYRASAKL